MRREFYRARIDAPLREIARYLDAKGDDFIRAWREESLFGVGIVDYDLFDTTKETPFTRVDVDLEFESTFQNKLQPGQIFVWREWERNPLGTYWIMASKIYCTPGFSVFRDPDWYTVDAGYIALLPGTRSDNSDTEAVIVIDNPLFTDYWEQVKSAIQAGFKIMGKGGRLKGSGLFRDANDFTKEIRSYIASLRKKGKSATQETVAALFAGEINPRQIRRWCKDFGVQWETLIKE